MQPLSKPAGDPADPEVIKKVIDFWTKLKTVQPQDFLWLNGFMFPLLYDFFLTDTIRKQLLGTDQILQRVILTGESKGEQVDRDDIYVSLMRGGDGNFVHAATVYENERPERAERHLLHQRFGTNLNLMSVAEYEQDLEVPFPTLLHFFETLRKASSSPLAETGSYDAWYRYWAGYFVNYFEKEGDAACFVSEYGLGFTTLKGFPAKLASGNPVNSSRYLSDYL